LSLLSTIIDATRAWRRLLALLLVGVTALALLPAPKVGPDLGWDKFNHLAAFAALSFSATLGWRGPRPLQIGVLLALLGYGGLIELLQMFVPNRSAEWSDLLADAIGIGIGALAAASVLRLRAAAPGG
jgi:VanZ family protein